MDKRVGQRINFKKEAEVIDSAKGNVICKVNLLNLSTGGVGCVSEEAFESTSKYILKFSLSVSKVIKLPIQIVGQHKKNEARVYSLKFSNINMLEKSRIRTYITSYDGPDRQNFNL